MLIKIDVTDWEEEESQSNIKLKSADDVIDAMQETDIKPMQAGRYLIVNRERGEADADVLPSSKTLLQMGAALGITQEVSRRHVTVSINGRDYEARQWVATVTLQAEDGGEMHAGVESITDSGKTLVSVHDPEAAERAVDYLLRNVTGRIYERMKIIAIAKGDVKGTAKMLKSEIDRIAKEFS